MRANRFFSALAAIVALTGAAAIADCRQSANGSHVVLYGTADDPDVFVWDSRFRLRSYQGGSWDQAQALLPHALLVPPGTRATIAGCAGNFVQSKYAAVPDDAVGIVIVSGPLKGKAGWVLGADVRRVNHK